MKQNKTGFPTENKNLWLLKWLWLMTGILCLCLLWIRPAKELELTFLDVGQGDSIFWRSDSGTTYLCDGGSSTVSQVGTYRLEPFLKWGGVGRLDYLMVTHMDSDHINGIQELLNPHIGGISIGCFVLPKIITEDEMYEELKTLAKKQKIPIRYLKKGDILRDGNLKITCLWPEENAIVTQETRNEASLVLLLEYNNFRVMLTGDLEGVGEEALINTGQLGKIDLLKAGHHGSNGATSQAFLQHTDPLVVILSYGENNTYGHPHPQLLERIREKDRSIYETAVSGAITVKSDGKSFWIETFHDIQ